MQLFIITAHCTSRMHCKVCRNKEGGRRWRESLTRNFELPDNNVDFECPYGVQWAEPTSVPTQPVEAEKPPIVAKLTNEPQEVPPPVIQVSEPRERSGTRGGCGCGRG